MTAYIASSAEDQGHAFVFTTGPSNTTAFGSGLRQRDRADVQLDGDALGGGKANVGFSNIIFKPWDQRERGTSDVVRQLQVNLSSDALERMRAMAAEVLPQGYDIDYAGQSRQTVQESNTFVTTLLFALLFIFLVLAAQFESFRDPLIILISVPMAIFGAMVFIFLGAATLNIYTQVGRITLVGPIAKHGILIVQYANDEQRTGRPKRKQWSEPPARACDPS